MILRNLVFLPHLLICRQKVVLPILWNKRRWWNIRSIKLASKKENHCNIVAMWLRHVILLVITSNNIPLSSPITFTYYLIPDGSPFQYTKPHLSIIKNCLSYIALLRSAPAVLPFVGKRTIRYHTLFGLISLLPLPLYNY